MPNNTLKALGVFMGSRSGIKPEYTACAKILADELVQRDITLVYGGARVGIMGEIAGTMLAQGGHVIGVIPQTLVDKEVAHHGITKLHIVDSMHERKAMMADLADAFIALPGGIGTMEEFFEVWTWSHIGIHQKPCGLLNVAGYYDKLIDFLDHMTEQDFLRNHAREMVHVHHDPLVLLDRVAQ